MIPCYTINEYLNAARERRSLPSDRKLSEAIKVSPGSINGWRKGRQWPSDTSMLNLCEFMGVAPAQGLLDLNIWRSKSQQEKTCYQSVKERAALRGKIIFERLAP